MAGLLNEFEVVGALFDRGLLDKDLLRALIGSESSTVFAHARWLTDRFRKDRDPEAGLIWERMNKGLEVPEAPPSIATFLSQQNGRKD